MAQHALPSPKFRRAVQRMVNAALEVERNWPDGMPYPQRLAYLPSWNEFVHDLLSLDEVVTHEYPARRRASTSKRKNPSSPHGGRSRREVLVGHIRNALPRLPYAYLTKEDVQRMVTVLPTNPEHVYEALLDDAAINELAENYHKADRTRATAAMVLRLLPASPAASSERKNPSGPRRDASGRFVRSRR